MALNAPSSVSSDKYTMLAAQYRESVFRCQQAIDQLHVSKRMLRSVTGGVDADSVPDVELDRKIAALSKRELQVFALMGEGLPTYEIAERLNITTSTAETYRERLKAKLKVSSGAALARLAVLWCVEPTMPTE